VSCAGVECGPGTHIALDRGDDFGPFVAGPEGVVLFEVMMSDPRSFPADLGGFSGCSRARRRACRTAIDMPDSGGHGPELPVSLPRQARRARLGPGRAAADCPMPTASGRPAR
jgi:hypothetical protein